MKRLILCSVIFWMGMFFVLKAEVMGQTSLSIEISREEKFLNLEETRRILEAAFRTLYPEKKYRVEVKAIHSFERIGLPTEPLICDIVLSEQARRGGNISASLFFRTHGREVGKTRVSAMVDISTDVIVAIRYIGKHQEVQEKDVQWVSRSLTLLPPDYLVDMKEVLGKRVTISLNRGEVLRAGIVEEPPLLKRGDRVLLVLENPQIRITTLGEVREEGRRGDRIKLVNLSSRKEVSGRIIDAQTVQIDF